MKLKEAFIAAAVALTPHIASGDTPNKRAGNIARSIQAQCMEMLENSEFTITKQRTNKTITRDGKGKSMRNVKYTIATEQGTCAIEEKTEQPEEMRGDKEIRKSLTLDMKNDQNDGEVILWKKSKREGDQRGVQERITMQQGEKEVIFTRTKNTETEKYTQQGEEGNREIESDVFDIIKTRMEKILENVLEATQEKF